MSSRIARIALVFSPDDPYRAWQKEFFAQTGLLATTVETENLASLNEFDVAIFCGRGELDQGQKIMLRSWYREGGRALLCVGSTWGLDDLLGVKRDGQFSKAQSIPRDGVVNSAGSFVFVGGDRVSTVSAEEAAHSHDDHATVCRQHNLWYFAPEVGRSLCLIGLGRSVGNDRIGPDDGSLNLEDGVGRAEDGCNLDWSDREELSGGSYFLTAHIDSMRNALVRTIVAAVEALNLRCAIVWHWPDNAAGAAVCTVEWDSGQAELVRRLAATLARFGMAATWLTPAAGQPQEQFKLLRSLGHDFGLLYRDEGGDPKADQIRMQHVGISRLSNSRILTSCRGVDGYWRSLTMVYEAIESAGGIVSVAKGGVRPGTSGFLFGTSRPFFPIHRSGRTIPVLEIPYSINQPGLVTPAEVAVDLAMRVHRNHGCVHFTVKPTNTLESDFEEALDQLLVTIRHNRMQAFLPERIYDYERARRSMRFHHKGDSMALTVEKAVTGVTLMVSGTHSTMVAGKRSAPAHVRRYGSPFTCATFDLEPRVPLTVSFAPSELAA